MGLIVCHPGVGGRTSLASLYHTSHISRESATMPYSDSEHSDSDASNTSGPELSGGKRAALTDDEIKTVKAIQAALKATNSAYCCSGCVPLEVKRPMIFYAVTHAMSVTEWTKGETPIRSE